MPKRGDIHPVTGLVYWDALNGRERWRSAEIIARWRAKSKIYVSQWQTADVKRHRDSQKRFREIHGVRRNAESRSYRLAWKAKKRKTDPIFRARECLSGRLAVAVRRIGKGEKPPTITALGCSTGEFIKHIESQFWPGMNWKNHAYYGWHIDHRIPLSSAKTVEEVARLCHYTNLQPLWWNDNFAKGSKLVAA